MDSLNITEVLPTESDTSMTGAEITETIFLGGVCVFGTIGNLLVVIAVGTTHSLQIRQNVFIVVLAITDLITSVFLTPFFMLCLVRGGWPYSQSMCVGIGYLTILCLTTSGLTVNCIAVCRYVTIAYTSPVRRKVMHGRVVLLASALLLVVVCASVLLPVFGFGKVDYNDLLGHCSLHYTQQSEWYYAAVMFAIGLVSTLTIVPISYGLIFWIFHKSRLTIENMTMASRAEIRGSNKNPSPTKNKPNHSPRAQQRKGLMSRDELRLSKKLLLLFGVFLFCWIPYTSVILADKDMTVPQEAHRATNIFLWLNACLNPFLYAWMIPNFRQAYKRLVCSRFGRKGTQCFKP